MEMTEITIRLPHAGAVRLIEEACKAGVAPDRFIAMLIEERLKQRSSAPDAAPPPPPPQPDVQPEAPELNTAGLGMLRKMLAGPGGPPGTANLARPKRTSGKRKSAKRTEKRKR